MKNCISLSEFAQIVMSKAQVSGFTRVDLIKTAPLHDKFIISCVNDFGEISTIEIPCYEEECDV